ncbi:hypothetical protein GIB67_039953, partial [Kingdonia uniflora]
SPAALTNQGVIAQLSEQITILNERMDEFTSRIEELNSKFTIRRVSNASHKNLALHTKACNDTATSLFVYCFGNGSLSGSLLPNSSSSSQLARDSPLMDEMLLIKRGQEACHPKIDFLLAVNEEYISFLLDSATPVIDLLTAITKPRMLECLACLTGIRCYRFESSTYKGSRIAHSYESYLVSFMDHTAHSLDSDSAVADSAGNIHSRASSSSRRRGPSRGSKPLPDGKKKKVGKFTNVPDEFIHIVKINLEPTFDFRRVVNFIIMRRMNDAWKRHKSRLNKKYIKGKTIREYELTLGKDKKGHMMAKGIDITPSFVASAIHIVEENEDLKATNNELKTMLLNIRNDLDNHIKKASGALQIQSSSSYNATSNSSQATQGILRTRVASRMRLIDEDNDITNEPSISGGVEVLYIATNTPVAVIVSDVSLVRQSRRRAQIVGESDKEEEEEEEEKEEVDVNHVGNIREDGDREDEEKSEGSNKVTGDNGSFMEDISPHEQARLSRFMLKHELVRKGIVLVSCGSKFSFMDVPSKGMMAFKRQI